MGMLGVSKTNYLIDELVTIFRLKRKNSFSPISLWFSYGSNLDESYFERKMKERGSELTLQGMRKATLYDFHRVLDNRSFQHGLGYAIHHQTGESVQGIVHEVPFELVKDFLRMEGVLNKNFEVSDSPSYHIIEVEVKSEDGPIPTFSLEGNKHRERDERERLARGCPELSEYVEATLRGALARGINPRPFMSDFDWLKSIG